MKTLLQKMVLAMSGKLSTVELRKRNRSLVFRHLYRAQRPKTKQEIANELGLSLPTVTQNLKELLDAEILEYVGLVDSTGGRRARTMQLVADAKVSIGVELSPKHIRFVAVNLMAKETAYEILPCKFRCDKDYYLFLSNALEDFIDKHHIDRSRLLGVGITLPGIVNEPMGMIEIAPTLNVHHMQISEFTDIIPYPVHFENDASAGGYAEWRNQRKLGTTAYLFVGRGIGGALLVDGKTYTGNNFRSAEFGHIPIVPNGKRCSCGMRGCLEAYCSVSHLTDHLNCSIEEFFASINTGNQAYIMLWKAYLEHLSVGIHIIRMMMDCEIVIGGMLAPFLEPFLPQLSRLLQKQNGFGDDGTYVKLGTQLEKANCIGVALHFVDQFVDTL